MKKGFGSVLTVIILGCMITLCLAFAEGSAAYCSRSCAENCCLLTGRSILSEYQKELYEKYGLFMLRGYDDELSSLAAFYLAADTGLSSAVLDVSCTGASVDSSDYRGLDTELFLEQAVKLGKLCAAKTAVNRTDLLSGLKTVREGSDIPDGEDLEEKLDELCEGDEEPEEGDEEEDPELVERIRQAMKLRRKLRQSQKTEAVKASGRSVPASEKKELPSQLLGCSSRNTLISAGIADISADGFFLNEYILDCCSNDLKKRSDTALELEAEYVIFGASSDSANKRLAKNNLYAIRFSLNMLSVLSDPELESAVISCSAAFSFIPQPVAVAAIASIWAGIETKQDLGVLESGGRIPLLKDASDFMTDIKAFMNGKTKGKSAPPPQGFGTYEDYLRIMLAMIPENERTARLMDVMQMNVSRAGGRPFSFRDYAYGFELDADFSRRHYLNNPFADGSGGHIHEVHVYR